ncbi:MULTISPECIES: hypothetical protein [Methanosarcina]|uniref:Uncharacterized protein n=3 Tax=Methanosarcina barkeri TaxID=2208 RepID=A0A0E3QV12_METBA|nr:MULTISPECIES: hypothetical protein [Methanosarcina]AKB54594.1 hypothetical protein MSBRM_1596 [Methanosarcina barkeri MS]AKB57327.1 hypothetical protein MSBR2_0811 [Methanosarcina barkeri 227]AKJ37882.1 hypothetical protein MCM1_0806 [Methanosarcina barkeri CM1]OED03811.1 hypothetical protein A9239_13420 [Methanosarcina sp. A14]
MNKPSTNNFPNNNFPNLLRVLKYEVLRLAYNKKYFYMVLIESLFACYILMNFVFGGKDGTAPFSKWTYSEFLSLIGPLLSVILVLFCMSVFSEKEVAVRNIIFSTPLSEPKYYLLKASAITAVFVLAASLPILLSFAYYAHYFNFYAYAEFTLPLLLFLLPSQIFVLGLALAVGRFHSRLLYPLLPLVLFLGFFNPRLPAWFDLFGNNFLSWPLRWYLGVMEGPIPYILPDDFLYSRLVFIFMGVVMFAFACRRSKT